MRGAKTGVKTKYRACLTLYYSLRIETNLQQMLNAWNTGNLADEHPRQAEVLPRNRFRGSDTMYDAESLGSVAGRSKQSSRSSSQRGSRSSNYRTKQEQTPHRWFSRSLHDSLIRGRQHGEQDRTA